MYLSMSPDFLCIFQYPQTSYVSFSVPRLHMYLSVSPDFLCIFQCPQTSYVSFSIPRLPMYLSVSPDFICIFQFPQTSYVSFNVPRLHMYLSVTPGFLSKTVTPRERNVWTINETFTMQCSGPVGTLHTSDQVRCASCCSSKSCCERNGCVCGGGAGMWVGGWVDGCVCVCVCVLSIPPSHSILTPGQPVPALTL